MSEKSAPIQNSEHVLPTASGGWAVRRYGAAKNSKTFTTQGEAISYARQLAKKRAGNLFVHGEDGSIQRRDSYAAAPSSSRR